MATQPTAGIYCRLSLASDESVSIDDQLFEGRKRAGQLGAAVVVEGIDNNTRARHLSPWKRPGWKEIVRAQPDIVIVREQSRIARNVTDWGSVVRWAQGSSVRLLTVQEEFDLGSASGRMIANILGSFAEYESDLIGERVRYSRDQLLRSGRRPGGRRPWVMNLAPHPSGTGHVLRPDPERAEILIEIVDRLEQGESLNGVCRWLQANKVPAPEGGVWKPASLRVMLKSPLIGGASLRRGELVQEDDGTVRIDEDQQVITFDRWVRLRDSIAARGRGWTPPTPNLLQGLLRCSTCGVRLGYAPSQSRPAYRCRNMLECSKRVSISCDVADEEYVSEWLGRYGSAQVEVPDDGPNPVEIAKLRESLSATLAAIPTAPADQIIALAEQRDRIELDLRRAQSVGGGGFVRFGEYRVETFEHSKGAGTWSERYERAQGMEGQHAVLADLGVVATVLPGLRGQITSGRLQFPDEG